MEEFPLPVESGTSYDSLKSLVEQAQCGDISILPVIRHWLDQVPALWNDSRVLVEQVERAWVHALSGQDLLSKEIIDREVQGLRSQLLGPHPTPLEKLLVDRICVCWLAVQHAELHAARRFQQFPLIPCESYATMVADSAVSVSTIHCRLLHRLAQCDMIGCLVESRLISSWRRNFPQ